ncbi:MAG: tetratricopeptide repeat protein [Candidatus Obscuribacterales bacterium]|nr:tetratricopeptide repeat protein [Candidatus Obscuribacterales bacterium]
MKVHLHKLRASISYLLLSAIVSVSPISSAKAESTFVEPASRTPEQNETIKLRSEIWSKKRMEAERLLSQGRTEDAAKLIEETLNERTLLGLDLLSELDFLGDLYAKSGNSEKCLHYYEKMLSQRQKQCEVEEDSTLIYPLEKYAGALERFGKKDKAAQLRKRIATVQRLQRTKPSFIAATKLSEQTRVKEAERCRVYGANLIKADLYDRAQLYLENSLKLNKNDAQTYLLLAQVYCWQDKFVKAKDLLDSAIKLNPSFSQAYRDRGYVWQNQKQYSKAIEDFEKAHSLNKEDLDSLGAKAKLLDTSGKHSEAVKTYSEIIAANDALYWPFIQRAVAYSNLKDFDKAIADYTVLVKRAPSDSDYLEYRAETEVKAGKLAEALSDYKELVHLKPDNKYFKEKLAEVEQRLKPAKQQN